MKETTQKIIDNIADIIIASSVLIVCLTLIFDLCPRIEKLEQQLNEKPKPVEILCEPDPNMTYNVDKLIKEYYEMKNRIQILENNCMERTK